MSDDNTDDEYPHIHTRGYELPLHPDELRALYRKMVASDSNGGILSQRLGELAKDFLNGANKEARNTGHQSGPAVALALALCASLVDKTSDETPGTTLAVLTLFHVWMEDDERVYDRRRGGDA